MAERRAVCPVNMLAHDLVCDWVDGVKWIMYSGLNGR